MRRRRRQQPPPLETQSLFMRGGSGTDKYDCDPHTLSRIKTKSPAGCSTSWNVLEMEDGQMIDADAPTVWCRPTSKKFYKQLSMVQTSRELEWERRRRQEIQIREEKIKVRAHMWDEWYADELRECLELAFGFREEKVGKEDCKTSLGAEDDVYYEDSAMSVLESPKTPRWTSLSSMGERSSSFGSLMSDCDDPEQINKKLRQWAQIVACSVMQTYE